jgi:putative flavoprotein involved in K+ transport
MSNADANQRAAGWLRELEAALARGDVSTVLAMFDDGECFWRDMIAFTWNIKTMEGKEQIAAFLSETLDHAGPHSFRVEGEAREASGVTEARFTFETKVARGRGFLRLKGDRSWTMLTTAEALKGFEEKCGAARDKGVEHGVHGKRTTWLERRTEEQASLGYTQQPYCLIIGGG